MGQLNNEPTAAKFDRHIADALARGARICCGGRRAAGFPTPLYAEPTVLDGVTAGMAIEQEEMFGPVLPVLEAAGPRAQSRWIWAPPTVLVSSQRQTHSRQGAI